MERKSNRQMHPALHGAMALTPGLALLAGLPLMQSNFPDYIPGYLMQGAAFAVAYWYAWHHSLFATYPYWKHRALLALSFVIPLQGLFFPRVFRKVFLDAHLILEVLRPEIILLIAVLIVPPRRQDQSRSMPWLVTVSFILGTLGWIVATAASDHPPTSFATGLFEFVAMYAVIYVFLRNTPSRDFIIHSVALFVVGCTLAGLSQAAEIFRHIYWVPFTVDGFMSVKLNVILMRLAGANAYGNSDNFVSLWVLALPAALALAFTPQGRKIGALLTVVLLYCGLLAYSRAGTLVLFGGLLTIAATAARIRFLNPATIAAAMLLTVHLTPTTIAYYADGIGRFLPLLLTPAQSQPIHTPPRVEYSDPKMNNPTVAGRWSAEAGQSSVERATAWKRGLTIGLSYWATGIGYGAYILFDPELTAPHSLALLRFAEGGILSLFSVILFAWYAFTRWPWTNTFAFGCAVAVACFLVKGLLFGATMSDHGVIVWGYGVGLLTAAVRLEAVWEGRGEGEAPPAA